MLKVLHSDDICWRTTENLQEMVQDRDIDSWIRVRTYWYSIALVNPIVNLSPIVIASRLLMELPLLSSISDVIFG